VKLSRDREHRELRMVYTCMNRLISLLAFTLAGVAGSATASEPAKPVMPDPDYCSRRDADPEKCVIQDSPPVRHYVRKNSAQQKSAQAQSSRR